MEDNPDYLFAFGTELHDKVVASGMDQGGRIVTDVGSDYVRVEGIEDGLETLSANMGIDIPDGGCGHHPIRRSDRRRSALDIQRGQD